MKEQIQVLNVRLPEEIVIWIDKLVAQGVYANRSEALREFIREYTKDHRKRA